MGVRVSANFLTPDMLEAAEPLTPWDLALLVKALVREALALYGITHAQLARRLGLESTARVDAALSDARDNAVPLWWFAHPGFPEQVRAHVFEGISRRTLRTPTSADTPEQQIKVAILRVSQFAATAAATQLEARVSAEAAAQLLRVVDVAIGALGGLASRLRQRVATGGHAAAKGGAR